MRLNWFNIKYYTKKYYLEASLLKNKKDNKKFTITSFTLEDTIMSELKLSTN